MKSRIGVIDLEVNNINSIINISKKIGYDVRVINKSNEIKKFDKIILPGIGNFDEVISICKQKGIDSELNEYAIIREKDILGICLGMQLMTNESEEGKLMGFGWINASCKKFSTTNDFSSVHMGWNSISKKSINSLLLKKINDYSRFYFVHSYFVNVEDPKIICNYSIYNKQNFVSSFEHNNINGVQFHPEKSNFHGLSLLRSFYEK